MVRRIIEINEEICNGCGLCAKACHEGAIGMVNGKAKLLRDDYCDGLGDCLPNCPVGAISFVEREAAAYDEAAVLENKKKQQQAHAGGCPGMKAREIPGHKVQVSAADVSAAETVSELRQWPVQIQLAPVKAPYFEGAKLLIAPTVPHMHMEIFIGISSAEGLRSSAARSWTMWITVKS